MALSPQEIRDAAFRTVKRGGLDPTEVESFKLAAADALQQAIQEGTAMEARARAAVARLQELSQQQTAPAAETAPPPEPEPAQAAAPRVPTVDESETISRTLLLAQRTADAAIADAENEAAAILDAARAESRRAGEAERVRVEGEVQALLARRDFLESDVDQLEHHLSAQRDRIGEVVAQLEGLAGRVSNGLAPMRRPQMSASDQVTSVDATEAEGAEGYDDSESDEPDIAELIDEVVDDGDDLAEIARVAGSDETDDEHGPPGRHTLFNADES